MVRILKAQLFFGARDFPALQIRYVQNRAKEWLTCDDSLLTCTKMQLEVSRILHIC